MQRAQIENDRTLIQFLIHPSPDANMARNTRLTPVASGQTQGDHQGYFLPSDGPCVTACKRRLDVPAGNGGEPGGCTDNGMGLGRRGASGLGEHAWLALKDIWGTRTG